MEYYYLKRVMVNPRGSVMLLHFGFVAFTVFGKNLEVLYEKLLSRCINYVRASGVDPQHELLARANPGIAIVETIVMDALEGDIKALESLPPISRTFATTKKD